MPAQRKKYLFLSHPRTGSSLLIRMLSQQPKLTQGMYFLESKMHMMVTNSDASIDYAGQRSQYYPKFQDSLNRLQEYANAFDEGNDKFKVLNESRAVPPASGGEILMFKEHLISLWDPSNEEKQASRIAHPTPWTLRLNGGLENDGADTNPTMFPDVFFDAWQPIMLIRHPALTFPSFYRASKEAFGAKCTDRWVARGNTYRMDRSMYDWYRDRLNSTGGGSAVNGDTSRWPLILDMHDMVNSRAVMEKFCLALELDPEHLRYEWDAAPRDYIEKQAAQVRAFVSTIHQSSGIVRDKAPDEVNIDTEYNGWIARWGVEDADVLRSQVESAMDDYVYLWRRRMVAT